MLSQSSTGSAAGMNWRTNQPVLDEWLQLNVEPHHLETIAGFEYNQRLRAVTVVQQKWSLGMVRVPGPYLIKILTSDANGPAGRAPQQGRPPAGAGPWQS